MARRLDLAVAYALSTKRRERRPMQCIYCQRERNMPCMNSRDMTDFAISGDDTCMEALEANKWGESGEQYVRLNREISDRLDARDETALRQAGKLLDKNG